MTRLTAPDTAAHYWRGRLEPTGVDAAADGVGPGVEWLMTSRRGGVGRSPFDDWNLAGHVGDDPQTVSANRAVIADLAGLAPSAVVMMRQCHSAEVAVVQAADGQEIVGVDALVTARPDIVLVALAADCVPVALADPEAGVIGAVHSGWQGMVSGVTQAAIRAMVDLGAEPGRIRAVLGPAICGPCYPVPPERVAAAAAVAPASAAIAPDGQPGIDVRAGLEVLLADLGVQVECVGGCTAESPELFSYRRDGLTGRQGAAVWRTT
ncbi:MAG: purine-nucleoside/S-methyl-5-thioadenosine phosphorylase / adenosine deaminase [Actinomycetota bacterium]|nr:purine-nucleoside/S-methyl-5-thioadenosine phosphorylase / adenosine deaminase [Actinomycetota bacterium]